MKKTFGLIWFLFCFISLFSCSQENDYLEEYIIEIDRQKNDSITPKDSIISPKDTIISPKDTTTTAKDTIISPKDTTTTVKDTVICSYEKYMNLSPSYGTGQGGACYDKYFIQGYQNNAAIAIFDLEKKKCLGKVDIPSPAASSKIHVNTVNFGSQRYDKGDYFPLLYISSGYPINIDGKSLSFLYVYRLTKKTNSKGSEEFNISLVQTISLKGFGYWTEGILDNDHNILWLKYEPGGQYKYASFNVPDYKNGDVEISLNEHLVDFSIGKQPFTSSNQGHLYYQDKIILVSGTSPDSQKLAFIVINLKTQTRELVIDLANIGLRAEPENVFFYKDQLMIGYRSSIYRFNYRYVNK